MDTNINKKKGNGIFLGIVAVATLIVAIIGATFAYFSASTQSEDNAVNLGAYEFKLDLDVEPIYPKDASALIPLNARQTLDLGNDATTTYLEYALNGAAKKCIDDNEMQVCALYRVVIYNRAANEVTLTGQLRTVTNVPGEGDEKTGFLNLTYQAVAGNHEQFNMSLVGDPVKLNHEIDGLTKIADITVPAATINEETGEVTKEGVGYGYVLIYLADNQDQSSEMGATYTGQLIYSSGDTGNTLTGRFSLDSTGNDDDDDASEPTGEPTTEPTE